MCSGLKVPSSVVKKNFNCLIFFRLLVAFIMLSLLAINCIVLKRWILLSWLPGKITTFSLSSSAERYFHIARMFRFKLRSTRLCIFTSHCTNYLIERRHFCRWSVVLTHYIFLLSFVSSGLLTKAIADAHLRTCLYTNEQIERMKGQLAPREQVEAYKSMVCTMYQSIFE